MKYLLFILISSFSIVSNGQDILGQWETYDDRTNEKKSIIEIYKTDDIYFAKIIKTFTEDDRNTCEKCKGDKKNAPIIGLLIIEDLKRKGNKYSGGNITDPASGETYKCVLKLIDDNKLKVRGFLGAPVFGRTQYWLRTET